jgi:surfactin synthase thioesterase subunit
MAPSTHTGVVQALTVAVDGPLCSGHAGPHSIEASAQDLQVLLGGRSPEVLIGHSMGGKVVMEFLRLAQTSNRPAPQQTWMLDAMPGVVAGDPHNARSTIETLRVLPQVRS